MKFSVDVESYNLAVHFLQDEGPVSEDEIKRFAQHIQDAVEDYLSSEFPYYREPEPAGSADRDECKHEAAEQKRLK